VSGLALPLIAVAALHASTAQVAALTALTWTPNLLGIALGAWIDHRVRKRRLMVAADLARALILLSLPAAYLFGHVTLVQLYAVALLTGSASVLFNTTYSSFFTRIVSPEAYLDANSKLSASQSVAYVAGPALGGALVQAFSAPIAVVADAVSFLASAGLLGGIRIDESVGSGSAAGGGELEGSGASLVGRIREGWLFVVHDPILRASLGCSTTINFFTFLSGGGLLVLFASRELGLSAGVIGVTLGVGATGSFLGAVVAARVAGRMGVGVAMALGSVLFPAPTAIAAAAAGPMWAKVVALASSEFLAGVGVMLFDVNQNSLIAAAVPDGLRSRVAGVYNSVNYGIRPLGALVGGALGTAFGLRATLLIAAAGGSAAVLWLFPSPITRIRVLSDVRAQDESAGSAESVAAATTT
jgi:MFS family permease